MVGARPIAERRERPGLNKQRILFLVVAVLALLLFAGLTSRVWHSTGPLNVDRTVQAHLPRRPASTEDRRWIRYLSFPGRPVWVLGESFLLAGLVLLRNRARRAAVFCAIVPIAVGVACELLLKPVIDRHNPGGTKLFFPSGHTTGVTSFAVAAWLTWMATWRSPRARISGALVLAAIVTGVGTSLVLLHHHYVSDVVGGALYAVAATIGLAAIWPKHPLFVSANRERRP